MNIVLDLLVCLSPIWLLFMNICRSTSVPHGGGTLGGIASTMWSYAWASDNPWYVILPANASLSALLNMMILGYLGTYIDSSYFNHQSFLLLSWTGNKMPHLIQISCTHPIQGNSQFWMDCFPSSAIFNPYSGILQWMYLDRLMDQAQMPLFNCMHFSFEPKQMLVLPTELAFKDMYPFNLFNTPSESW